MNPLSVYGWRQPKNTKKSRKEVSSRDLILFHLYEIKLTTIVTSLLTLTRLADGFGLESRPTWTGSQKWNLIQDSPLKMWPLSHCKNGTVTLRFPRFPYGNSAKMKNWQSY